MFNLGVLSDWLRPFHTPAHKFHNTERKKSSNECSLLGDPLMTQETVHVPGRHVMVRWMRTFEGQCPPVNYTVYYKEVNSKDWNFRVNVPKGVDQYDLELECFKAYDVAVNARLSENLINVTEEAPRDAGNHWKVLTGQGKKIKSLGVLLIGQKSVRSIIILNTLN